MTSGLTVALIIFAIWAVVYTTRRAIRDDYRTRNDQVAAQRATRLEDRPEPACPGSDEQLLAACRAICPDVADQHRKEKPQP